MPYTRRHMGSYSYRRDAPCILCRRESPDDTIDLDWGDSSLENVPCCFECKEKRRRTLKFGAWLLPPVFAALFIGTVVVGRGPDNVVYGILVAVVASIMATMLLGVFCYFLYCTYWAINAFFWLRKYATRRDEDPSGHYPRYG